MSIEERLLKKIKECAEKNNGILSSKENNICYYLFPSNTDYKNFLNDISKEVKLKSEQDEPQKIYVI